jgi:hypothetical protein
MTIEPTDEMVLAFEAVQGTDPLGNLTRDALAAVLALVERDYLLTPICNAELMPGVVCKRSAINPRHKHEATLPATGSRVEWS